MASRIDSAGLATFAAADPLQRARNDVLDLHELPPCGRLLLDLGADEQRGRSLIQVALGLVLPHAANTVMLGEPLAAWLGPARFLLLCAPDEVAGLCVRIANEVQPHGGHCVDISAAQATLRVCGAAAEDCLASLTSIDLRRTALGAGACAQTRLLQANALILRTPDGSGFDIHVDRSYAAYAWRALLAAGRDFGLQAMFGGHPS